MAYAGAVTVRKSFRRPHRMIGSSLCPSSTQFIDLDAAAWSNNTVRVMARNISAATFDLAAATLSMQVVKRRIA